MSLKKENFKYSLLHIHCRLAAAAAAAADG
jgi:hypothetical protein